MRNRVWRMTLAGACICVCSAVALAQDPSPEHLQLLDQLRSLDFAQREQATEALLADESLSVHTLKQLFVRSETSEQVNRLDRVARHHVLRRDWRSDAALSQGPGAVGVYHGAAQSTAPGVSGGAVCVYRTMPGFPGHVYLRPGDLIVAVNGQPLVDAPQVHEMFVSLITAHRMGDTLTLDVIRDGHRLSVEMTLASKAALATLYPGTGDSAAPAAAFNKRWLKVRKQLYQARAQSRSAKAADRRTAGPDEH